MTFDTNELRRLAQSATPGHWQFWRGWVAADIDNDGGVIIVERPSPSGGKHQARVDNNFKFIAAANPATIFELLDRLEAAEKERDAAELMSLALRAKIAEMEKQEPVAEWVDGAFDQYPHLKWREPYKAIAGAKLYTKFYALPGAKGEGK